MEDFVSILGIYNNNTEHIGTVSKTFYERVLKRLVKVEQSQVTGYKLKCVLFEKGWLAVPPGEDPVQYLHQLDIYSGDTTVKAVYDAIFNSEASIEFLKQLLDKHIDDEMGLARIYTGLIDQVDVVHIESYIGESISNLFNSNCEKDAIRLLRSLWGVTPSRNGVAVGKGEIALSLLAGAKKANDGDLALPDDSRLVELKGPDGKLGSKPFAATIHRRLAELLEVEPLILYEKYYEYEWRLSREDKIADVMDHIKVRRELLKTRATRRQAELEVKDKLNKKDIAALGNLSQVKKFLKDVGNESVPSSTSGTTINTLTLRSLKSKYGVLQELRDATYTCTATDDDQNLSFNKLAKLLFIHILQHPEDVLHGKIKNNLYKIICEFRNYDLQYDISNLEQAIKQTVIQNNIKVYDKQQLSRLIMLMHMMLYWRECQFTDIQFLTNNTLLSLTIQMNFENTDMSNILDALWQNVSQALTTTLQVARMSPTGVEVKI